MTKLRNQLINVQTVKKNNDDEELENYDSTIIVPEQLKIEITYKIDKENLRDIFTDHELMKDIFNAIKEIGS